MGTRSMRPLSRGQNNCSESHIYDFRPSTNISLGHFVAFYLCIRPIISQHTYKLDLQVFFRIRYNLSEKKLHIKMLKTLLLSFSWFMTKTFENYQNKSIEAPLEIGSNKNGYGIRSMLLKQLQRVSDIGHPLILTFLLYI